MDPVLVLSDPEARVDPGGETRVRVSVRNVGDLVEQYQFEVLGDSARWAQVVPRQVSVLPHGQEEKTVEVVFRPPPPPGAPAGEVPFGVRCVSLERRDRCAVVEGDVAVGAVHNLSAKLEPVSPRGRWSGRYRARFDNSGSVPVTVALAATDTKQLLRFALAPQQLTVAPGQSAPAYLSVRPRQPIMRGKPADIPFVVSYQAPTEGGSGELAGAFEQRPIISKTVVALVAAVLALAVGAGALVLRAGNKQTKKAALTTEGPPPPTALTGVQALTGSSVQIVWNKSPYATGYVVQQVLANGTVAGSKEISEPDQSTMVWPGLKPGKDCFQVLTVGKSGRSAPSKQECVTIAAPPPPTTPPATSAVPTSAPPTTPDTGGGGSGPVGTGGTDTGGKIVVQGFYVIYATVLEDDTASQGLAAQVTHRLQVAGSPAKLIDSKASDQLPDGQNGIWYVLLDGFPSRAAAQAECNKQVKVAPNCIVQEPPS
ncbi:MAG: hypothetical protein V7637_6680 [Mycobacteriales bacterium]